MSESDVDEGSLLMMAQNYEIDGKHFNIKGNHNKHQKANKLRIKALRMLSKISLKKLIQISSLMNIHLV